MGDDNDTTAESVDSVRQTVDSGDIETVGRLVEKQHVGSLDSQQSEHNTRLLTIGQSSHLRRLCLTGHTVATELLTPVLEILGDVMELVTDEVKGRLGEIELFSRMLAVHTELQMSVA